MQCFINQQEVCGSSLARREMNFSQPMPGVDSVKYRISLPVDEFGRALQAVFQRAAAEEKADDRFHERGECPTLDHWAELGFPSPGGLVEQNPRLLEGLIRDRFDLDTLDRLLPGPSEGLPLFLANTIDQVLVRDGCIHIEGSAYIHPQIRKHLPVGSFKGDADFDEILRLGREIRQANRP